MKPKRCKVCGYKFQKDDGDICPECLSSREDTISCEDLSEEDHSHEEFGESRQSEYQNPQNSVPDYRRYRRQIPKNSGRPPQDQSSGCLGMIFVIIVIAIIVFMFSAVISQMRFDNIRNSSYIEIFGMNIISTEI